mgnify:CR=1 FL=1
MIDIVCVKTGADQFLEQIGFLVRSLCGTEPGKGVAATFVDNFFQAGCREVECLVPCRFTEIFQRVCRVELNGRVFCNAFFPDQRFGQPVRVMNVVKPEPAFDAEPVVVRRPVATFDEKQLVVLDVVGQLAADTAIRLIFVQPSYI